MLSVPYPAIGVDGDTVYATGPATGVIYAINPRWVNPSVSLLQSEKQTAFPVPDTLLEWWGRIAIGANHTIYESDDNATVHVINGTKIPLWAENKTENPVVATVRVGDGPTGLTVDRTEN